jgi:hypothetical protein
MSGWIQARRRAANASAADGDTVGGVGDGRGGSPHPLTATSAATPRASRFAVEALVCTVPSNR